MDAAFMSFQQRDRGIHAVQVRCWRAQCDGSPFQVRATASDETRADQDQLKLTGYTLQVVLSWLMPYFAPVRRPPGTQGWSALRWNSF